MEEIAIPIGAIINISSKIAEYFHLFEGVLTKTNKLVHQAFKSATENLMYARNCSGTNQLDYLKRAKDRFIDAIVVEEMTEKVMALSGLAIVQYLLGEKSNAHFSMKRIEDVKIGTQTAVKGLATAIVSETLIGRVAGVDFEDSEVAEFYYIQEKVIENTKKIICN